MPVPLLPLWTPLAPDDSLLSCGSDGTASRQPSPPGANHSSGVASHSGPTPYLLAVQLAVSWGLSLWATAAPRQQDLTSTCRSRAPPPARQQVTHWGRHACPLHWSTPDLTLSTDLGQYEMQDRGSAARAGGAQLRHRADLVAGTGRTHWGACSPPWGCCVPRTQAAEGPLGDGGSEISTHCFSSASISKESGG